MSIIWNIIGTLCANITSMCLGFIISVTTARILGIDGQGIYTVIGTTIVLVSTICNLGINQAIAYYSSQEKHTKEFYFSALMLQLLISVGAVICLFLLDNYLIAILKISSSNYMWMILCIPAALLLPIIRYHYIGTNNVNLYNLSNLLEKILSIIVLICILFFSSFDIGLMFLIPFYITLIFTFIFSYKQLNVSFNKNIIIKLFNYSIGNYIGLLANFLSYRAAIFIINFLLTKDQVGIYSISLTLAELFFVIPNTLNIVLFKKISESSDIINYYSRMLRLANLIIITGVILFILFGKLFIEFVYGNLYTNAYLPTIILLLGVLWGSNFKLLSNLYIAQGKVQIYTKCGVLNLISMIILDLTLIPFYGLIGAALAALFSYFFTYLYAISKFKSLYNVNLKNTLIATKSDYIYIYMVLKNLRVRAKV